ncbi:uncharacterized protein LOC121633507 isoform X2 [Melanotaenia boesemani]|uniref:uncharacterized protein LOC121633507 isoform X2 n=1 Tax=Melanotaenia boesemani TaxID=1250792 RepID=UPI001C05A930|nr:uncharacterized protein LOC121633507 isoform X2 [Melanotaenia boesemani]
MFGLKSFKLSLLLTWMLPFTETQQFSDTTATVGDDVTLTCEGFREFNDQCFSTTWLYSVSGKTVTLYEHGKIHSEAGSKSDRLNVTEKCFLVIKKVTVEDEGLYTCRQFESSESSFTDSSVQLSVTNISEKNTKSKTTSSKITSFSTTPTTTKRPTTPTTTPQTSVAPTTAKTEPDADFLLASLISAAVASAALLITTVMIIRWRKTKGNKTRMKDTIELSFISAGTRSGPETSQDMADPSDGVHVYASINDTNLRDAGAQVRSKDSEEHGAIYSLAGVPAAASTDPHNLYSTIQEYR